ncbi:M3 family metallopeptidase [Pseudomonas agarici]|uniref:M3 family metallopeptidase n=1 Tax=Pseudomonas agarici TaxID=46677 RepID=UPI0015A4339F|nr:oligopeptidase A [Pseudomonas agarici]
MGTFNPLLQAQPCDLPAYSSVRVEHLLPALDALIKHSRRAIDEIVASQSQYPTWDDFFVPVDALQARLSGFMGVVSALSTARPYPHWGGALQRCRQRYLAYRLEVSQHPRLFQLYEKLANCEHAKLFDASRVSALQRILLDCRLAGAHLAEGQKTQLQTLDAQIKALESRFLTNVYIASEDASLYFGDDGVLDGVSSEDKTHMELYHESNFAGWWLNIDDPQAVSSILVDARGRELRQQVYEAVMTRASDPETDYDNSVVLDELLQLRFQKAGLLGFANSAALRLQSFSLSSPEQVERFLRQQVSEEKPGWLSEVEELKQFAAQDGLVELKPWDRSFYAQRLRLHKGAISEDECRAYFELEQVLKSLLALPGRLFGVEFIARDELDTWHASVRPFEVREQGQTIGYLFLDLFAREEKTTRGGAMFALRHRLLSVEGRTLTAPIAVLSCYLPATAADRPLLLKHGQIRTLFHEFGHCLHQLLDRSNCWRLSAIESARDVGEFFSALLECWCYSRTYLVEISRHHETGAALSVDQADQLMIALTTQNSLTSASTLILASLALELHQNSAQGQSVLARAARVRDEILSLPAPGNERQVYSFKHLVTETDVAYFIYPWGQMLAKAVFSRFEDKGLFDPVEGRRLRELVFAPGASQPILTSIEAFLGRTLDEARIIAPSST